MDNNNVVPSEYLDLQKKIIAVWCIWMKELLLGSQDVWDIINGDYVKLESDTALSQETSQNTRKKNLKTHHDLSSRWWFKFVDDSNFEKISKIQILRRFLKQVFHIKHDKIWRICEGVDQVNWEVIMNHYIKFSKKFLTFYLKILVKQSITCFL